MSLLVPTPDYTDRDFDSVRLRLQNLVKSVFPEWTDFNAANFGNILLELFAFTLDVLGYYQDNQAAQSRISTATQREALLGLVKLLGYKPSSASAATVDVTLSISAAAAGNVLVPAGTFVATEDVTDPTRYQTLADATIPAGQTSVVAPCENSENRTEFFVSTGLANQVFPLAGSPFIDASVVLLAGDGAYVEVSNFLDSGPSDRVFTVSVDQNDKATLRVGNGTNGSIPVGTVQADYKVGGGKAGRVDAGKLKIVEGIFTDVLGNSVQLTATNALASSGGDDRESIAQIKERAPASIRVNKRSVTREDFEINALRVPGVARALMLTRNEDPAVAENWGSLYVVPQGGGVAAQPLLDAVKTMVTVTYPSTLTFSVAVASAVYLPVDVRAIVFLRQGAVAATVRAAILAALQSFFAVTNSDGSKNEGVDFGANLLDADGNIEGEIAWSDVHNIVRDVTGVRKVSAAPGDFTLNGDQHDIALTARQFPTLGTLTITNGDTGQPL